MRLTPRAVIIAAVLCICSGESHAALVNIALDVDSATSTGNTPGPLGPTQAGFHSWNISNFHSQPLSTGTFTSQGVTFELLALQPPRSSNFLFDSVTHGSRHRWVEGGGGGPYNDVLADFAFAEGRPGTSLVLRITGLPVGTYRVQSWHYDAFTRAINTLMQIEVGNKQGDVPGAGALLAVDHFPLSETPQSFFIEVTSPAQVKEIVFRNDNGPAEFTDVYRTRLNGFTLTSVPEPGATAPLLCVLSLLKRRQTSPRSKV
jgi:hypothetical protein